MTEKIKSIIKSSIETKERILQNEEMIFTIRQITDVWVKALTEGKKILFCGNGGSAADAQHLAAELSGRFYKDREPLYAEALHVNTSYLTAVANDYSYDEVYSRLVKAKGREGDILVALSTSGNSSNILKAIEQARISKMITVGMTGESGGKMKSICQYLISVPSNDTPRIQESHILLGHILCELTEEKMM